MTLEQFLQPFLDLEPPKKTFYRLYHDDQGHLLFYSMDDLPGLHVEIDVELYRRSPSRVRVIDGRVHELEWRKSVKLRPNQTGTPCHPEDVTIVYDYQDARCWAVTAYEQD